MPPELRKLKIQKAQELKGDDRCHGEYFLIMESFKHVRTWTDNVMRPVYPPLRRLSTPGDPLSTLHTLAMVAPHGDWLASVIP